LGIALVEGDTEPQNNLQDLRYHCFMQHFIIFIVPIGRKMKNWILPLALCSSFLLQCAGPSSEKREQKEEATTEQKQNDLPKMMITTLDKTQVNARILEGNIILILFQPDCDHCQREAKEIRAHLDSFKEYSIFFISADQMPAIEKFGKDYDLLGHQNIQFAMTTIENVLNNFGSIPAPSIYIYRDQKLVQKFNGEVAIEKVLQLI
jgi:peroxiredoxin